VALAHNNVAVFRNIESHDLQFHPHQYIAPI
jgi:hypothetical protein